MAARCEPCKRDFFKQEHYEAHLQTHERCHACEYSASRKFLEVHIRQQHETGRASLPTLDTPEQIAAWIAERKKKWPSAQNLKRRQEEESQNGAKVADPETKRQRSEPEQAAAPPPSAPNPLGIDYGESASSDDDDDAPEVQTRVPGLQVEDEAPPSTRATPAPEVKALEPADRAAPAPTPTPSTPSTAGKRTCRYFMRGSCRNGSNCQYSHERSSASASQHPPPAANDGPSSLLKSLLANDVRRERFVLLQCIQHLVSSW